MVVKLKDSQVFKNIYVKEFLDDQQEEVRCSLNGTGGLSSRQSF